MNKIIKIVLIAIGLLAAVLWFSLPSSDDPDAINSGSMNFMFIIMYLLLAIAAISAIVFGFGKLFSTPGSLKKALFAIGGLALSLIHISEPTRLGMLSRMPSSA